jgi:DNA-binding LytR/AlgR family response regulator
MNIRCLIIDDEYLARQYIADYVRKVPFLDLKGDYNSPLKAIDQIKAGKIDLIFLDIQMPDITGLDFLKTLDKAPFVIITTAYKEYALEGYELNVSDYLLKPFSFERFLKAVNKVLEIKEKMSGSGTQLSTEQSETTIHDDYIIVRADRKHYKINYEDLIYIEGQKAYVTFHTSSKRVTALASLKDLEEKLPDKLFIRIHKSYIVSIKKIDSLEGNMIEIGGKHLPIGKSYKKDVETLFGLKN